MFVQVTIGYNKLGGCEAKEQGRSFDMLVKKMKHKMVENMSSSTADALGLSRAILCNDGLIKKMQEMEKIAGMYRGKSWKLQTKNYASHSESVLNLNVEVKSQTENLLSPH